MGRKKKQAEWDPSRLRQLRTRAGLTQLELAQRCDLVQSRISAYEHGYREPKASTIMQLAAGLGVEPGELLGQ